MNADGSGKTQLTSEVYEGEFVESSRSTWSPDGTKIALGTSFSGAPQLDGVIHLMNPDGTGRVPIIDSSTGRPLEGTSPDWQPLPTGPPDPRGCTKVGTSGNDVLDGTPSADIICGLSGNDTIQGLEGDDILYGDGGKDKLLGDPGSDQLKGGSANDSLNSRDGVSGNDLNNGGTGTDRCTKDMGDTNNSCDKITTG
jgi:Ca2+-binding RTX toxin-like protein